MRLLCEIISQDVLPVVRALVSKELIISYNMNQSEVANLLGVSQPAVSQYIRHLRGRKLLSPELESAIKKNNINEEIKKVCGNIYKNRKDVTKEMFVICKIIASDISAECHKCQMLA